MFHNLYVMHNLSYLFYLILSWSMQNFWCAIVILHNEITYEANTFVWRKIFYGIWWIPALSEHILFRVSLFRWRELNLNRSRHLLFTNFLPFCHCWDTFQQNLIWYFYFIGFLLWSKILTYYMRVYRKF